jgi:DNA replication protein DnaC
MPLTKQVTFDFEDFNTSTRRDTDTRKHGIAEIRNTDDGVYIYGSMGCGKTRANVGDALTAYLGGRTLLAYRIWD